MKWQGSQGMAITQEKKENIDLIQVVLVTSQKSWGEFGVIISNRN